MSMMPVVDAIGAAVPVPAGIVRDDSGSEPMDYAADRLYAWADGEVLAEEGTGRQDEGEFFVLLALTIASPEADSAVPLRTTSLALDTGVDAITAWVRVNRTGSGDPPLWEDLQVVGIQYGGLRGFDYRGHRVRLRGTRYLTS